MRPCVSEAPGNCFINQPKNLMVYNTINHQIFWLINATFNNISVILWRSVLLVEETKVPRENH